MPSFFVHADVMLVALRDEYIFSLTIPAKTQTYMAFGKPIVSMLNGESNKVIEEAGCGFTANAGDFKALAANVIKAKNIPSIDLCKSDWEICLMLEIKNRINVISKRK